MMDVRHRRRPPGLRLDFEKGLVRLYGEAIETDEDVELVGRFEVCSVCEGRGKVVNPAIDSHGLTAEAFAEDPDFAEGYFSGRYDINCGWCGGRRVELLPDEDRNPAELLELYREVMQSWREIEDELLNERRQLGAY